MTVPVISSVVHENDVTIHVLTSKVFVPFFEHIPNVNLIALDKLGEHKGFIGIFRLFNQLRKYDFDAVVDLHDVLRTKTLRALFSLLFVKVAKIDKGRNGKADLIKNGYQNSTQLTSSFERYAAVFKSIGLKTNNSFSSIFSILPDLPQGFTKSPTEKWIGIAPFAKHVGKIYVYDKMQQVIKLLGNQDNIRIFLLGHKGDERDTLISWLPDFKNTDVLPEHFRLREELALMAHLDVVLSMDSANMHLASMVNVPVVSVWGATHRFAGFLGWGQSEENCVEIDLPCRPCSVFGNKPCHRKDYACMTQIQPETIVKRINNLLSK